MSYYEYKRSAIKFENSLKKAGIVPVSVFNKWLYKYNYVKNNAAHISKYMKNWRDANKDYQNVWCRNNKAKKSMYEAKRRDITNNAISNMSDDDIFKINNIYQTARDATINTGYAWEVDHIVPLSKGGLHTLNNLQVVPATWNRSKNNKNCDRYWD